jgi:hypothetical protein
MGHPQPATPIATDNSTSSGIMNRTVKHQCSKTMDMRFYWVQDRVDQEQFIVYWAPGHGNLADYFTKHHPQPTMDFCDPSSWVIMRLRRHWIHCEGVLFLPLHSDRIRDHCHAPERVKQ